MTQIEQLKVWYQGRPDVIKQAIDKLPPTKMYRFKSTGKQCWIFSYEEPESGKLEDVTITVQKTGKGGLLSELGIVFSSLDTNQVFGVALDDLELWED